LLYGIRDFFFLAFFVTVAQVGAGADGAGLEEGWGGGGGAGVDPGFGTGEDDGGDSFALSLRSMIFLFSMSIWKKRRSVLVV
jgi:hypothetical protein